MLVILTYMEIPQHILDLIEKYLAATISKEELIALNNWYHTHDDSQTTVEPLISATQNDDQSSEEVISRRIYEKLLNRKDIQVPRKKISPWKNYAAAIALLISICGLGYFYLHQRSNTKNNAKVALQATSINADLAPGGNKARLTLADGSVVILDSLQNGSIAKQGGIDIQKLANGQLTYNRTNSAINATVVFNQISTPRGGTYRITLADGTKVWLNAASELKYPTTFKGATREVVLKGEAYFEVAKNAAKPFLVHTAQQTVQVLGTHFDVNAYQDEPVTKTTLLEGRVKVIANHNADQQTILVPGQQSALHPSGKLTLNLHPDLEQVTGWKDGFFVFHSTDLKSILRLISRWYDADIEYKSPKNPVFTGQISKQLPVSKVFALLSLTNEVHYSIEGKTIIVTNK